MSEQLQPERYMTKEQAATYLQVSQRALQDWMARRLIPYFKIGRAVRFRRGDLDATIAKKFRVEARL